MWRHGRPSKLWWNIQAIVLRYFRIEAGLVARSCRPLAIFIPDYAVFVVDGNLDLLVL